MAGPLLSSYVPSEARSDTVSTPTRMGPVWVKRAEAHTNVEGISRAMEGVTSRASPSTHVPSGGTAGAGAVLAAVGGAAGAGAAAEAGWQQGQPSKTMALGAGASSV